MNLLCSWLVLLLQPLSYRRQHVSSSLAIHAIKSKNNLPNDGAIQNLTHSYHVYLLKNTANNCTYIGSTNNLKRRLRQHNGEIVGGAKYTHMKKGTGEWRYHGYISNLEKRFALSIEKKIQLKSRKSVGKTPLLRRLYAINTTLQATGQQIDFTEMKYP